MSIPATWLYVATGASGVRKVGSTIDPLRRVDELRAEYWQSFTLDRTWHRPQADGRLVERLTYQPLRRYRSAERPLCFELYDAPLSTIYAAIERAVAKIEAGDLFPLECQKANRPGPSRRRTMRIGRQELLADWASALKEAEEYLADVR